MLRHARPASPVAWFPASRPARGRSPGGAQSARRSSRWWTEESRSTAENDPSPLIWRTRASPPETDSRSWTRCCCWWRGADVDVDVSANQCQADGLDVPNHVTLNGLTLMCDPYRAGTLNMPASIQMKIAAVMVIYVARLPPPEKIGKSELPPIGTATTHAEPIHPCQPFINQLFVSSNQITPPLPPHRHAPARHNPFSISYEWHSKAK